MDDDASKVKPFLLNSIARFLESNGFSRTLKKFRSEAHFEEDDVKIPTMDLEELFFKFMGSTDTVTSDATKQDAENKPKHKKKKASNSTEVEVEEFIEEAENNTVDSKSALNPSEDPSSCCTANAEQKSKHKKKASRSSEIKVKESKKEDAEKKSKDKKKKSSRSSDHEVQKCREGEKNSMNNGKPFLDDRGGLVKYEDKNSNKAVAGKENNAMKKRKRHELKDCETTRSINGDMAEESRLNDTDVAEDVQTEKKKLKASKNTEKSSGLETITNKGDDVEIQEVFGHCIGASKSSEKEGDKYSGQKSMKKQNGSAEPTSAKAFQRVKVEEVIFSDERLKDNSYWAKDGAEKGYGAKAQEVLGQVRGRDFRHEKTKKKRGSYRGGQIDLQSHSVKFNYSDDE